MADLAFDLAVGGRLPALKKRLHVMAGRAEFGGGGQFDGGDKDDQEDTQGNEKDLQPLFSFPFLVGCDRIVVHSRSSCWQLSLSPDSFFASSSEMDGSPSSLDWPRGVGGIQIHHLRPSLKVSLVL
jgi:hypothetical protein